MIIIGASAVDAAGVFGPFIQPALWDDACIPGLRDIAEAAHRDDTKLLIQILYAGVHRYPDYEPEHRRSVAPSQIPAVEVPFSIPREIEVDEILAIEDKFADTVVPVTMKYSNTDILRLIRERAAVPVHAIADVVADATRLAHAL